METKVELVKGTAFELDPTKSYLILFKHSLVSRDELQKLTMVINDDLNVKNVICTVKGDVEDVKIVEATPDAAE